MIGVSVIFIEFIMNKLAIIVPVYNEGNRAILTINKIVKELNKGDEVVVVDDGSNDDSWVRLNKLKNERIHLYRHVINLGKGAAMKTGILAAWRLGCNKVIFIDADGQHEPRHLKTFKDALEKFSVVFGRRKLGVEMPFVRRWGNLFSIELIKTLFKIKRGDLLCGYFGFTKEVYSKLKWTSTRYGVETEIATRVGKNEIPFTEVDIDTIYIDKYKGVTILDAFKILFKLPGWYIRK